METFKTYDPAELSAFQFVFASWGRDYGDVTPMKGVIMGGGVHTLSVMVDLTAQV